MLINEKYGSLVFRIAMAGLSDVTCDVPVIYIFGPLLIMRSKECQLAETPGSKPSSTDNS